MNRTFRLGVAAVAVTGVIAVSPAVTGGDTRLIGIDYRVQDGNLYGVGDNAASAGVYIIDPGTGVATQVTRLTVAPSGTTFGVDFTPAANALPSVSDSGQNLRQPFATPGAATVADGPLSDAPPAAATGIDAAGDTGFDIYSTVRDGSTVEVLGFAVINGSLYEITLFDGKATARGTLGAQVTDLALPLDQR